MRLLGRAHPGQPRGQRRAAVHRDGARRPADRGPGGPRLGHRQGDRAATDLDPEVGQLALDWGRENLKPEFRGDEASGRSFGPEVAVAADAPLYDRLAGFFGRDPR
jgi:hypothetical protein